jgi:hypothetical protein
MGVRRLETLRVAENDVESVMEKEDTNKEDRAL